MLDNWFRKVVEKIFSNKQIIVFVDESKKAEFLLECVDVKKFVTKSEIDELHIKYQIEKNKNDEKYLIYTQTPKKDLKFLREYCETNGIIEIKYLHNFIKEKVYQHLKLNINLNAEELIVAGKVSFHKKDSFWKNLSDSGEIFNLSKDVLEFVNNPVEFLEKFDNDVQALFFLSKEIVDKLFNSLLSNNLNSTFKEIYSKWLDSVSYRESFYKYLSNYQLPHKIDIWKIDISHPFKQIDELCLIEIGKCINDKKKMKQYLQFAKNRQKNKIVKLLNFKYWNDIVELLAFDEKKINRISSFTEAVDFHKSYFYKLDNAIRNLYKYFLNKVEIIENFQMYYKDILSLFLDKWFLFISEYNQNQTGFLYRIFSENSGKIAVIIGDGVTFDIAKNISSKISGDFKVEENHLLSDFPSETENNMSQLFIKSGEIEKIQKKREKILLNDLPDKDIGFMNLEDVNESTDTHQYLVCPYKDIDSVGEKLQHKALKFFDEIEDVFSQKIKMLLNNGYEKIYLIADHGFVLTGFLAESDKIEVNFSGNCKKNERYILCDEKQNNHQFIEFDKKVGSSNFIYFSKNINPFKTPGVYGFSHGGLSPQELIVPNFVFSHNRAIEKLSVSILDKTDLMNVTGDLFTISLMAEDVQSSVFNFERNNKSF